MSNALTAFSLVLLLVNVGNAISLLPKKGMSVKESCMVVGPYKQDK